MQIKDRVQAVFTSIKENDLLFNLTVSLVISLGVFFRFFKLGVPVLWIDESWRALMVIPENLGRFDPVPPVFLLIPNLLTKIFGNSELILRLPIAFFGSLSLVLIFFITRKMFGRTTGLIAVFLLAFHPQFIFFSRQFKQFSMDVFIIFLAIYVTERMMEEESLLNYFVLALFSIASMFFSFTMVFIYPVMFIVLLFNCFRGRNAKSFLIYLAIAMLTVIILAGYSFQILMPSLSKELTSYWQPYMMSSAVQDQNVIVWFSEKSYRSFYLYVYHLFNPVGLKAMDLITPFFIFLVVLGCYKSYKRGNYRVALYCIIPPIFLAIFSSLGLWPYGSARANLFYFSVLFIPLSLGVSSFFLGSQWAKRRNFLAGILLVLFILVFLPFGIFGRDQRGEDIRPGVQMILENAKVEDAIFVYSATGPPFEYYYRHYSPFRAFNKVVKDENIFYSPERENNEDIYRDLESLFKKNRRVWVVCSHVRKRGEIDFIKKTLNDLGSRIYSIEGKQTWTYLYLSNFL
jgi:hypothetical protein